MKPKSDEDLLNEIAVHKFKASIDRLSASLHEFAAAIAGATIGAQKLGDVLAPMEEWPDVVLEDILDAEVIGE